MVVRWRLWGGLLSVLLLGTAQSARAEGASKGAQASRLMSYRISSVSPYEASDGSLAADGARIHGVAFRVEAQPGLTGPWLQRSIEESLQTGECNLGGSEVKVAVHPMGDGFDVQLITEDEREARALLPRVKGLAH